MSVSGGWAPTWKARYGRQLSALAAERSPLRSTTALAFYAAMLADFQAVTELGWIAGSGVLLCALSCFTVLPALLMVADRRANPGQANDCPRGWIFSFLRRIQVSGQANDALGGAGIYLHRVAFDKLAVDQLERQRILDQPLDGAPHGPRAVLRIVAFVDDLVLGRRRDFQLESCDLSAVLPTFRNWISTIMRQVLAASAN